MRDETSPIVLLLTKAQLTRHDVAYHSRVSLPTIDKLCRGGDAILRMRLSTIMQISLALGCAPAEIIPMFAKRPRAGLLWTRGVYVTKTISKDLVQ